MAKYSVNLSAFLLMFGVGMTVALLPRKIIHLSGTVESAGYLASAFALTFVLVQIPIGKLSDRYGFKLLLICGYLTCACSGLLYYFADSAGLICIGRMLQGIGEVPVWALAPVLLAIQSPGQKGKVMGGYNASLHCGLTAGSLSGIWTGKVWQGNEVFLLFAGMSVLGGLLLLLFVKEPNRNAMTAPDFIKGAPGKAKVLPFLGKAENSVVFAGILLYGAGYGLFITMIPGFLIHFRHSNQAEVGMFFVLFYIAISMSQMVAGPLSDKKGRKSVMILGLAMAGTGLALFAQVSQNWIWVMLTLAALGLGSYCVAALAFLNDSVSHEFKLTFHTPNR